LSDFTTGSEATWFSEDGVVIAEYWWKERAKKKIYQLSDGRVVDEEALAKVVDELAMAGVTIKAERETECDKIKTCLVYGGGVLEEAKDWPGKRFPFAVQWGDYVVVEGKEYFSGMVRHSKDSQRLHNFWQSTMVEVVSKLPNSPLTATPQMVKGLESYYERMGWDDPPVLLYNPDPSSPTARPTREPIGQFPAGLANMSQIATDEMKAVTGVYDASLGAQSNETSGRAIMARNQQGDTANFVYTANQSKFIRQLGEIILDLLSHYYDGERMVQILGEDMAEKVVKLNEVIVDEQTGEAVTLNDMSAGKYGIVVGTGKAYETQRLEVADAAQALVGSPGPMGILAQYLLIQNLDVPGMDEFKKAARKMLVGMGLLEAGEGDQPPQPPQPNPKDVAGAEKDAAQAAKYQAETDRIQFENQQMMALSQFDPMAGYGPEPGGPPSLPTPEYGV
ncbi:MAG: portal protein, partial [Beijerinckiaceae bacterium]